MIKNYYYLYETIDQTIQNNENTTKSQVNVFNAPLRFKRYNTTAEIIDDTLNYIEGEIVYNLETHTPCIRTNIGWSSINTTVLS